MNAPFKPAFLTYAVLNEALPAMEKGQRMVYHVGSLMFDRVRGPMYGTIHGVALAAYEAYQRGEVHLVQRKIAPLQYEYIAIRR